MQNHQSALDSFMEDKAIQDLEDADLSRMVRILKFRRLMFKQLKNIINAFMF